MTHYNITLDLADVQGLFSKVCHSMFLMYMFKGERQVIMSKELDSAKKSRLNAQFDAGRKNINQQDISKAADNAGRKITELEAKGIPKALEKFWGDITVLWQMLHDSVRGEYKIPFRTAGAVAFALLYFINPVDLVPDLIPVAGYIDDAFVISLCISFIEKDLEEYKKWRENRNDK